MCEAGECRTDGRPASHQDGARTGEGAGLGVTDGVARMEFRQRLCGGGGAGWGEDGGRETERGTDREKGVSTERHGSRYGLKRHDNVARTTRRRPARESPSGSNDT